MRRAALLVGLGLGLFACRARANGRFPAAEQIVVQPGAPRHLVVRTTFGILTSTDGGGAFDWICEDAAHYGSGLDPGIAVTADGTILAGIFGGVSAGHGDACTFDQALAGTFITDVTIDHAAPDVAYAIGSKASGYFLWRSPDDGKTWSQRASLPAGFIPATVDVAPGDSQRLYASGGFFADGGSTPTLARSIDGGKTFEVVPISTSAGTATPYIAGIDPIDPLTVWVRPDVEPGVLFVTHDGGDHWDTALTLKKGMLEAFAIAPDGSAVLAGGPEDGLWSAERADAGPSTFAKISDVPATCLAWPDGRVLACADETKVDYAVAESVDGGRTFTSLLPIACVRGPLDCKKDSGVAKSCTEVWPRVATQIKHATCDDAGTKTASASTAASAGAGGASSTAGAGGSSGPGTASGGGCGCGCAPAEPSLPWILTFAVGALSLVRRNRSRPRA
jgi:hypothetical protein